MTKESAIKELFGETTTSTTARVLSNNTRQEEMEEQAMREGMALRGLHQMRPQNRQTKKHR